ncbi:MAG: ABC transporter permease [Candidatus Eisenbacteria bacterium]|uniref:ABC transporter permease n=1 Tax=Eiseniibacteriota bacterium TaxID=2212470 RepID=A0A538TMX4_UNCEI|nr:MAG: ABC transporter permease [Candidatus Eisenbacteria bacterium]
MSLLSLVLVNLGRNKRRTILTALSVLVALFLFCALRGVLDTLEASIRVGSEARLVTRNAISLIFPLPLSYQERLLTVPGVRSVSYANWFGGRDPVDQSNFYAQFAVAENYLPIYASDIEIVAFDRPQVAGAVPPGVDPKLAAFMNERDACVVGERLFNRMKWKLGQTVPVSGTIFPGTWTFTVRAVYHAKNPAMNEEAMFFHWKYLSEKGMGGQGQVGWYVLELSDPGQAGAVTRAVDALYANSAAATHTETERAFQAGFVSMYGNVPFLIGVIGLAVVFAILLVAANTMMMATRERTAEFGVMKTLGFDDGTIFRLVLVEAAVITFGGGALGALLAKLVIEGSDFNAMGLLPPMTVRWATVLVGVAIAVVIGAASGLVPAWQASQRRIVDALRRVE